jgi:hypothetical protein
MIVTIKAGQAPRVEAFCLRPPVQDSRDLVGRDEWSMNTEARRQAITMIFRELRSGVEIRVL